MKIKERKTEFVFHKDNLKAGKFTLSLDELKNKYREWIKTQELSYVQYYGHQTVVIFITSKEGLSSTFEQGDIDQLQNDLMGVRHEFYNSEGL